MSHDNVSALIEQAVAAQNTGDVGAAEDLYERLIAEAPTRPEGYVNLGRIKQDRGELETAEDLYRCAISVAPNSAFAHLNLGVIHILRADEAAAAAAFEKALQLDPDLTPARFNLAGVYQREGRIDDALAQLSGILEKHPGDINVVLAKVPLLFESGQLDAAWEHYNRRYELDQTLRAPLWRGENIKGKKVFLCHEQGLGEQIMFASMVPELLGQGAALTIEVEPRLVSLFTRSFPSAAVLPWQKPRDPAALDGSFDMYAPIGNAGAWMRNAYDMFPLHRGYLKPDPSRADDLRTKYKAVAGDRKLVGLSWHSSSELFGRDKSVPPADLTSLLNRDDVLWVNLQHGAAAGDIECDTLLRDPDVDPLADLDGLAAQVEALDLVVSVSNTTAHIAGALGKPVHIMLPKVKNRHWYWFPSCAPNPWYPSLKPFVQDVDGVWTDVVNAVDRNLDLS
jgi:tetratricopeptide (TPR) repeat protein